METHAHANPLSHFTSQFESALNKAVALAISDLKLSVLSELSKTETPITLDEAEELFKTSKPTLIKLAKNRVIRSYQFPDNKRTYFIREELISDLKQYRQY
ncbi:hypothetical protein [Pontibacter virosus]|uniref:Excisionase family DNA binding protein n=1 Tax=Pontibacter virosus TaxID=1765052 RepID=A0A2U1AVC0_9BACT|nr:hypothetical protein [Pontibacter virosus]PVY40374.1 hypothetical protein C8E01_1073 [Pontibacter virosus]